MGKEHISYDDILSKVGGFGHFQKVQFLLLNFAALVGALHGFNMVFNGATPEHHCKLDTEVLDQCNISYSTLMNFSIPKELNPDTKTMVWSGCSMRDATNYTDTCQFPALSNDSGHVVTSHCSRGWEYSDEVYKSTIVTEWDLVCKEEWKRSLTDTLFFAGRLFGAIIFGHLADRFGRKPMLLVSGILQAVFGVVTALMPRFVPFAIFYFLQGAVQCGTFILAFVYVTEIVCPSKRKLTGMANRYFYCLGQMVLAGIAALLRDWRAIELCISLPGFFFISYIWFVPESGRWLLSKGRIDEMVKVVEKIAAINDKPIAPVLDIINSSGISAEKHKPKDVKESGIKDLFSNFALAKISLITWFLWLVNSTTYVAMALQTRHLEGNPYLNFLLSAMVELPALTLVYLVIDRLGRKVSLMAFMVLAAISCFAAAFVPNGWLDTALIMVAKFGVSGSFAILFLMSAELFPTSVRNMAMGVSAMCGHLGGTLAPVLIAARQYYTALPMLVFGSLLVLATLGAIFVPEMLGCPLPQTIEDLIVNVHRGKRKSPTKQENNHDNQPKPDEEVPEMETNFSISNPVYIISM